MTNIPFNKPYLHGRELVYIADAVRSGKISGDGIFTKKCHEYFELEFGFKKALLTTSCTDALEMAAILLNIKPGDEVILPSFTFVSTANAFVLRGAKLVFADSCDDNPNISPAAIESLVTPKTKAIVVVHYAGVACDMDTIVNIANQHRIPIVEDAAQAIDSYYKDIPLGSIGTFGAFSFHETKNIISGEGGMLAINDTQYTSRAEVIREKGTNRSSFFRGEVDKYGWVDIGSSFLPSELIAAYLYAQLENLRVIQNRRKAIWEAYHTGLRSLADKGNFELPNIPFGATNNAHMFYLVCKSVDERSSLIAYLKSKGVHAVFHYIALHTSQFFLTQTDGRALPNCDRFSDCLVRLPMYYELLDDEVDKVIDVIHEFFTK
ncbi:dTDP-4-amino-4,6-dideoxygalactose transaminase [Chitinimonas sp. BJB300]|uniref:dTDP-4-amino-4,6-dideoxygalactose transaminase n=1 Tax=Chitinimonas sp. BJB300 TaxID=1559339 RepID=UPI000C0ED03B|nr:dTDP-4-amino-4,6-dideoxygalactose transaminase [Chitinimonas sp. BJB300]PHV11152.1 dTDP-4-amino-4,6-dideoxygalactose transaminase [Chitinimonas sp. BJB300]TSJ85564.1 dTDP-4-amino-4,6-dideoxygalactose transaminase [Chitinimonas sp. BJB300]